jgi:hypothetical protein
MGLPRPLPPKNSGSGHGPFGQRPFYGALIGCGGLVVIGLSMVLLGGEAATSVGTSFLVLGVLGLVVGGGGLLAERYLQRRRPPPPPEADRRNGRGSYPPDARRVDTRLRRRR